MKLKNLQVFNEVNTVSQTAEIREICLRENPRTGAYTYSIPSHFPPLLKKW
jgi:hypothetical protein